jgi:hypothetical protein
LASASGQRSQQILSRERVGQVQDLPFLTYCLGRVEAAPADKYGQAAKQRLFARFEKVVTPGNGVAQRLLPSWCVARPSRQQLQATLE